MSWDSCGGSLNVSLGFVAIQHSCYKDKQIQKVSFESKISFNLIGQIILNTHKIDKHTKSAGPVRGRFPLTNSSGVKCLCNRMIDGIYKMH